MQAPWPLNAIISAGSVKKYQQIFVFLLQVSPVL